jgi:hypothetical protein
MSTVTQPTTQTQARQTRQRPPRKIRLLRAPTVSTPGACLITVGNEQPKQYVIELLSHDYGQQAFRLIQEASVPGENPGEMKVERIAVYDVLVDGPHSSCDCPGQIRWGHRQPCKHIAGLQALQQRGLL